MIIYHGLRSVNFFVRNICMRRVPDGLKGAIGHTVSENVSLTEHREFRHTVGSTR